MRLQRTALISIVLYLSGCTRYDLSFISAPCLLPDHDYTFRLCNDFTVRVDYKLYSVPKGFKSDLASVPRPLWGLYSPNDTRTIPAAVLHDYLYHFNHGLTRKQADDIFYNALVKGGTKPGRAIKYYIGVRLFGWQFFKKDKF